jgi:hypothetical protein
MEDAVLDVAQAEALVRGCLASEGHALLRVTGACLEPALFDGERVRLAPVATHPPRFGDVVLARMPEGLRLHRLVWPLPGLRSLHVRTKADRSPFLDAAIPSTAILATALDVERGQSVPARDMGRALRSLAAAVLKRLRLALTVWFD